MPISARLRGGLTPATTPARPWTSEARAFGVQHGGWTSGTLSDSGVQHPEVDIQHAAVLVYGTSLASLFPFHASHGREAGGVGRKRERPHKAGRKRSEIINLARSQRAVAFVGPYFQEFAWLPDAQLHQ